MNAFNVRSISFTRFLLVVSIVVAWCGLVWLDACWPRLSAHDSVAALNGGAGAFSNLVYHERIKNDAVLAASGWTIFALAALALSFYPSRWRIRAPVVLAMIAAIPLLQGCARPYDTPEYEDVDTAETAFVVPVEGDTADQAQFESQAFLEAHKVAAKRVQITHRWNQTGRGFLWMEEGEWIPDVRLIKVNRSPITRQWTADADKDKAIWVESADSVGFSMGFVASAFITEEDAARFLYWYPAGSLSDVMDSEIRARIQQDAAEVAAKYPLDELRGRKQEIMDGVRKDVVPFFAARGITVSTIGMYGGMTYENPGIQQAIDDVFVAQQLKDVNLAKYEAQEKANEQLDLEAAGLAKKAMEIADGEAQARITAAQAEAKSIEIVDEALAKGSGPQLLALRQLDIEKARVEKWDGQYPTYFLGGGSSGLMMNMAIPTPGGAAAGSAAAAR